MDQSFKIASLLRKKIKGEISSNEEKQLQQWIEKDQSNSALYERILNDKTLLDKLEDYQLFDNEKTWSSLEKKLFKTKIIRLETRRFLRYAAILIPLIIIAGLSYYWKNFSYSSLAKVDEIIKPYEQKALLILANGDTIDLQSENITNIQEGRTQLISQNHTLKYTSEDIKEIEPLTYNTLVTPKGAKYQLKLSDGTEVWLNANSSIKYPVAFTDSKREVFLEGEAFFDVQHNGKSFFVNTQETNVKVLGTSFNVSAYPDELYTATTLVEGSVKMSSSNMGKVIVPNEQASVFLDETDIYVKKVNTDLFTSWMKGKIEFESENLEAVMRRLSRIYDFEYSFENEAAKDFHFTARIDDSEPFSSILEMLGLTTNVEFKLKENKIIIL